MPIYAYKCSACGFAKDTLQKLSDPALTVCPECGQETFSKQVTAAGFQLKGSGWYVTDFRNNGSPAAATAVAKAADGEKPAAGGSAGAAAPASGESSAAASAAAGAPAAAPAASPASPAAKPTSGSSSTA